MGIAATASTRVDVPDTPAVRRIRDRLGRILPLLGVAGRPAAMRLVGGLPRALLTPGDAGYRIPRDSGLDVDAVMETNAIRAGRRLQAVHGGELTVHERFQTATWRPPEHLAVPAVDLITARSESYPRPGQLPKVAPGTFGDDCFRRDFTVNTLALDLAAAEGFCKGAGPIVFHHHPLALEDLRNGIIRVLHSGSFVDDPTRLFRAVRYEQRLGFRLEAQTRAWFLGAVDSRCPATVSGTRIRHEVELGFMESRVVEVLNRLSNLGLAAAIGLEGERAAAGREACGRLSVADARRTGVGWLLMLGTAEQAPRTVGPMVGLPPKMQLQAEVFRSLLQDPELAGGSLSDLELARRLGALDRLVLESLQAFFPHLRPRIEQLMARAEDPRPRLGGRDLIRLGYEPGRAMGRVLDELRILRLAGVLRTIEEEMAWVRDHDPDAQAVPE